MYFERVRFASFFSNNAQNISKFETMKKLTINKIIAFKNATSDRRKKNFALSIKANKPELKKEGGGNYWTRSLSAMVNAYRDNDLSIIIRKIKEIENERQTATRPQTKAQYTSNIELLGKYERCDFKKWKPSTKQVFIPKHKAILTVKDLQIEVSPNHVVPFTRNNIKEVGAIWFIAKKEGYRKEDLGMFTDILYRYLKVQYGKDYELNSRYCIAVDLIGEYDINYAQLEKGEVPAMLNRTIEEIKKLM